MGLFYHYIFWLPDSRQIKMELIFWCRAIKRIDSTHNEDCSAGRNAILWRAKKVQNFHPKSCQAIFVLFLWWGGMSSYWINYISHSHNCCFLTQTIEYTEWKVKTSTQYHNQKGQIPLILIFYSFNRKPTLSFHTHMDFLHLLPVIFLFHSLGARI